MSANEAIDDPQDVRPVIATGSQGNWAMWAFGAVVLVGGALLFNALSAAEEADQVPTVFAPQDGSNTQIASPPPLRTPERFEGVEPRQLAPLRSPPVIARSQPVQPAPVVRPVIVQPTAPTTIVNQPIPPSPEPIGPQVVFDSSTSPVPPSDVGRAEPGQDRERVTADRLLNPSYTIPQGTVIPAVLETAIDSTRAGGVRALVQRDIFSFDGTRMLIPRGSRLYGEYDASIRSGQNRALVQWTRLIRPDGVTIALDSPSSDPLGRAGIRGRVDSKFFQRFGGAILQSVLDIGVGLAVNEATDGVFVALPGSTQNVQIAEPESIQPTLRVRHGTSVSVFVARDLDFSSVDP